MHPLDYLATMPDMNNAAAPEPIQSSVPCRCPAIAMAYVPPQEFANLQEPEVGFDRGTIFRALDLPYLGKAVDA